MCNFDIVMTTQGIQLTFTLVFCKFQVLVSNAELMNISRTINSFLEGR